MPNTGHCIEQPVRVECASGESRTGTSLGNIPENTTIKCIGLIPNAIGRKPSKEGVDLETRSMLRTAVTFVRAVARLLPTFSRSITSTMTARNTAKSSGDAVTTSCCGSKRTNFLPDFKYSAGIANGARGSRVFVLTGKPVTTSPCGRRAKRPEAGSTPIRRGNDIVCSAQRCAAVA